MLFFPGLGVSSENALANCPAGRYIINELHTESGLASASTRIPAAPTSGRSFSAGYPAASLALLLYFFKNQRDVVLNTPDPQRTTDSCRYRTARSENQSPQPTLSPVDRRSRQHDRRPGSAHASDAGRPVGQRAPADRRRAGPGQDDRRRLPRQGHPHRLSTAAVHARPVARRLDRHADLPAAGPAVRRPKGADLFEPDPGRRNQPRPGQGAERAARSDAGAAGHDRPARRSRSTSRSW